VLLFSLVAAAAKILGSFELLPRFPD